MNGPSELRQLGQCLWLDYISRALLDDGRLDDYVARLGISGLTSNPTIFDQAIGTTRDYDEAIAAWSRNDRPTESLFLELALADVRRAADRLHPIFVASAGADGWVSMEISPLLAGDAEGSIAAATAVAARAGRRNLLVKIPGTKASLPAVEEAIYLGVPVNVTLLFSWEHYQAAADAYMRGIERRLVAGLDPRVASVASLFVSRWDRAVSGRVSPPMRNRLGIAVARNTWRHHRQLLQSERWLRLAERGAVPQRLLWASTGTKDPEASPTLYVEALVVAGTICTVPEPTLLALAGRDAPMEAMPQDDDAVTAELDRFASAGIDVDRLAARLQDEGARSFEQSWRHLMSHLEARRADRDRAGPAGRGEAR